MNIHLRKFSNIIQVSHVKKIEEDRGQRNWNNRNNWAAHIGTEMVTVTTVTM